MSESLKRITEWIKTHPWAAVAILAGMVLVAYLVSKRTGIIGATSTTEGEKETTEGEAGGGFESLADFLNVPPSPLPSVTYAGNFEYVTPAETTPTPSDFWNVYNPPADFGPSITPFTPPPGAVASGKVPGGTSNIGYVTSPFTPPPGATASGQFGSGIINPPISKEAPGNLLSNLSRGVAVRSDYFKIPSTPVPATPTTLRNTLTKQVSI